MDLPTLKSGPTARIVTWIVSVVPALGIGLAGASKLAGANPWRALFLGWGYPAWCSTVVGIAEVAGAIGLLVPRLAAYAALALMGVMMGALVTLVTHPGGPMGWGATPLLYLVLLAIVAATRWRARAGGRNAPVR